MTERAERPDTRADANERPGWDPLLTEIADYAAGPPIERPAALDTARLSLADALGCGLRALGEPDCTRLTGAALPGREADPLRAAFALGTAIRWLDWNDTWLAAEWGHPSDNLGAVLAAANLAAERRRRSGRRPLTVAQVLDAAVRAHEIQGILALGTALNRHGLDHVVLVRAASAAVAGRLLGLDRDRIRIALSHAFADGGPLRTYRHAPNTGPRKSWAAGDATARGLRLALLAETGEPGYPSVLSAPRWGFQDALLGGEELTLPRPLGSYVMENVLFKVDAPTEFHAQTALEAAIRLHPRVRQRIGGIERIELRTHESAIRIISKTGPLHNPADRDHCLQYVVAVGLLRGRLTSEDYSDAGAADPRIDALRERMTVSEDPGWSADYLDPAKRSAANAVRIRFADGTATEEVAVEYPLGHPARRAEALAPLAAKLRANLDSALSAERAGRLAELLGDGPALAALPVPELLGLLSGPDR